MTAWAVTHAKAKLSEVLDMAESQGPQLIQRRKQRFVLLTEQEYEAQTKRDQSSVEGVRDAWEATKPSFEERYNFDIPKLKGGFRLVDFA